jgi:hypothetical protein
MTDGASGVVIADRVDLDVAGIRYAFTGSLPPVLEGARRRLASRVATPSDSPDLSTHVTLATGEPVTYAEPHGLAANGSTVRTWGNYFHAVIDLDAKSAELQVWNVQPEYCIENYIRGIGPIFMLKRNGLQFHGSSVVRDGRGYLFIGPSGAGKTTTARLSSAYTVFGDDQSALFLENQSVVMRSLPPGGIRPDIPMQEGEAPLARILWLKQDETDYLETVSRTAAIAMLASQAPVVNVQSVWAPALLDRCAAIVDRVPVSVLHFRKSNEFWQLL